MCLYIHVFIALTDICAKTKQNKSSGRNGSPFDFLYHGGIGAEGGQMSRGENQCVCVCIFTYDSVCKL